MTGMVNRRIISLHNAAVVSTSGLTSMQQSYRCHISRFRNVLWVPSWWFGSSLIIVLNCFFLWSNQKKHWCKVCRSYFFFCLLNMPKTSRVSKIWMMANRKNWQMFHSYGMCSLVDLEALCNVSVQEPLLWVSYKDCQLLLGKFSSAGATYLLLVSAATNHGFLSPWTSLVGWLPHIGVIHPCHRLTRSTFEGDVSEYREKSFAVSHMVLRSPLHRVFLTKYLCWFSIDCRSSLLTNQREIPFFLSFLKKQ